jgi:hypothetical protein
VRREVDRAGDVTGLEVVAAARVDEHGAPVLVQRSRGRQVDLWQEARRVGGPHGAHGFGTDQKTLRRRAVKHPRAAERHDVQQECLIEARGKWSSRHSGTAPQWELPRGPALFLGLICARALIEWLYHRARGGSVAGARSATSPVPKCRSG